ncbi:MAG: aspartate-semialdehyde dehydrogenase [Phycisphaerales bacterium]|nr:aspartate-semialdehyde dehydrogenase [Phycisphaerales bacterium]
MSLGRLVIVGATGAVGREALGILEARGHPAAGIAAVASARSSGAKLGYAGGEIEVAALSERAFEGADVALFCADAETARRWAPVAVRAGAVVVDNSSAFRMDPDVPLVIPEVNGGLVAEAAGPRIIANPNCSTIILLAALNPLRAVFGVERIVVATYQAVSGAGAAAIDELHGQARAVLGGGEARPEVFREPCAFNVFSHDSAVDEETGLNVEEQKLIAETRKIWGDEQVEVTPTCVRVPVVRAHTEAITVTLARSATEEEVRRAIGGGAGLAVIDDRPGNRFPTPLKAAGGDEVLVGRIRRDPGRAAGPAGASRGWCLLVCGDQLRKGAALNAVQIADLAVGSRRARLAAAG